MGLRQIFVRFSGCSLTCDYCDTQESRIPTTGFCVSSLEPGDDFIFSNPVPSDDLTEIVDSFHAPLPNLHHSISLTGGEPLEQVDFLREWLPEVRKRTDLKIYLETNGLLPAHLSEIIDFVDIIGMDIKLPSVAGVKPFWNLHRDFLKTASRRAVSVKVVVSKNVRYEDVTYAADVVCSVNREIPFILQPQTPIDLASVDLLRIHEHASKQLSDVRVVPQVHKLLSIK